MVVKADRLTYPGEKSEYLDFKETKWLYVRCHPEMFPTSYLSPKEQAARTEPDGLGSY
jgi:hypothetical protein